MTRPANPKAPTERKTTAQGKEPSDAALGPPPLQFSKAPTGRKTIAQGKEPSAAALGQPPPQTPSPEGATQMPKGWARTTLGEFGELFCGQSLPATKVNRNGSGVPYVTGPEHWDGQKVHLDKWTNEPARMAPVGCIFITVKGAGVGKLFPGVPCAIGRDIYAYRASAEIPRKFVELSLRFTIAQVVAEAKGDIPGLSKIHILDHTIPLPPLAEQRRIVAKIEELFSELDAGEESLRRARRQLGVYRQSLLKQAFEGKRTEEWRKQNSQFLESPDQLLGRIHSERQARYSEELKGWEAAGRSGSKPKKPKDFDPLDAETLSSLRQIPVGWAWVRFGNLLAISSGNGLTAHQMKEGPYPVYGGNGISGYHDAFMFVEPQMVIGRVGAKCGITHITAPKSWVTDNALVCEFQIQSISMEFMSLLLNHLDLNKLSVSTAQPVVSGSKLNPLPLPLCSLPEQHEIVRLLDEQFTVIEQNEREIDAALKRSAALRQSILKKAFTGQLVPQDPTDEPASALLERIREERATHSTPKKTIKKSAVGRGSRRG